jgi:glycine/D-amino acid oxidase-like deaminating enzyme/nitrite reductase/ring-hydroxylating ferredoxin subunit
MSAIKPLSVWQDTVDSPRFAPPARNHRVDVIVVGAGITGVTTAFLLKKAGLKVALLERERIGGIDTTCTTAHLTRVTDLRLKDIVKVFGADAARAVWDAGGAAIDQIAGLVRSEAIDCDFKWVPGYLHAPVGELGEDAAGELRDEAAAAEELGIAATFMSAIPSFAVPGIKFPHQALFHPRKYLAALVRSIDGGGSYVFEQTPADEILDEPVRVKTGDFEISADYIVLATHNPLAGNASVAGAALFQTKLSLYSSYAVGARVRSGLFPEASFWDTSDPYYYLRVDRREGHDYAIFGGEDHKTGQVEDTVRVYERLEKKFHALTPDAVVDHRWSGQVIETSDGLPLMGETSDRQFVATGYAGNGMTFGTLAAMMAVDAVQKRKNPWAELFNLGRKTLRGGTWTYVSENKDYPYYLVRNWMAGSEGRSLAEVGRDEGRILNLNGKKVAAYRNEQGAVSLCSPVCTHLQCIVAWNNAERTWDCPCHGSRFKPTGEVISGPAEEPLPRLNETGEPIEP